MNPPPPMPHEYGSVTPRRRGGRDRRVDGVAAVAQHLDRRPAWRSTSTRRRAATGRAVACFGSCAMAVCGTTMMSAARRATKALRNRTARAFTRGWRNTYN